MIRDYMKLEREDMRATHALMEVVGDGNYYVADQNVFTLQIALYIRNLLYLVDF